MLIFLIVILGLSVLILSHELGHLFAAKLFRLKVDEFGFGFPPRIFAWRFKKSSRRPAPATSEIEGSGQRESAAFGETEYSINWLPFGGFVRIAGESDRIADGAEKLEALPEEEKKRYFFFQPAWKKAAVTAAGVAVNFVLGWFLLTAVLMVGLPQMILVSDVQAGSPAEHVGILPNDAILGFADSQEFLSFIEENKGQEIILSVRRGGEKKFFSVVPRAETVPGEGALGVLFFEGGEEKRAFFSALGEAFRRSLALVGAIFTALFYLIRNLFFEVSLLEGVVGPVGIFAVAYDVGGLGFVYLAQLIAVISINLAAINLIPFPALDGGRLLIIAIEKIKGSTIPRKFEAYANVFGFAFLLALMAMLTVRDIGGLL